MALNGDESGAAGDGPSAPSGGEHRGTQHQIVVINEPIAVHLDGNDNKTNVQNYSGVFSHQIK